MSSGLRVSKKNAQVPAVGSNTLVDIGITSVIDEGTFIEGNLTSPNSIMFKGAIKGILTVNKTGGLLLISHAAKIEGGVIAEDVLVMGEVIGSIKCKNIRFRPGSKFRGSLEYERIGIDPGSEFTADKSVMCPFVRKEGTDGSSNI